MEIRTLKTYLEYTSMAYNDELGKDFVKIDTSTDVQGYMMITKDNTIIIGYRGTNSFKDVMSEVRFWKKKIPYGDRNTYARIHTGFLDAFAGGSLIKIIDAFISKHWTCKKVIVCGHSFGATTAILTALHIQYNWSADQKEIICVTSGSPRVGNRAFYESYTKRVPNTYRVVNCDDIIPKLPPFIFNYKHVGKLIKLGKSHWWKFWGSWKDHSLYKYLENCI